MVSSRRRGRVRRSDPICFRFTASEETHISSTWSFSLAHYSVHAAPISKLTQVDPAFFPFATILSNASLVFSMLSLMFLACLKPCPSPS